jgi:DNA mismatch repair protein MutL
MEFCSPGNGDLKAAIYAVYGKDFANDMLPVDYTAGDIRVRGYTIKPLYSKNNRSFQNFFVGSRYVFSKICSKALESAYETLIMVGKFPACVLDIIMPPDSLDVNIHPAKAEVRFTDEKAVSDAVFFAVKNALMQADLIYDFQMPKAQSFNNWKERAVGKNTDFVQPKLESGRAAVTASAEDENDVIITVAKKAERDSFQQSYENISSAAVTVRETVREAENIFSEPETIKEISSIRPQSLDKTETGGAEPEKKTPETALQAGDTVSNNGEDRLKTEDRVKTEDRTTEEPAAGKTEEQLPVEAEEKRINVIGEAFKNYIIAEADENVIFIDKHAAHERVLYEKLRRGIGRLEQQYLLTPSKLLLSAAETDARQTNRERLLDLGFIFDFSETPFVLMKAVPMFLDCLDADEIVSEIAENLMSCKQDPQTHYFEDMLHTMACKAAIKENFNNLTAELQYLADEIYDDINIRHCPHGRPILFKISKNELDKQFGRIQ